MTAAQKRRLARVTAALAGLPDAERAAATARFFAWLSVALVTAGQAVAA